MKQYLVRYERDEAGYWIATVPKVKGCHTYGRTIEQAKRRIREALSLFVEDADEARLIDEVRLSAPASAAVRRAGRVRRGAERQQALAAEVTRNVAQLLTRRLHLSVRDAGTILGLSHQRVQQIVGRVRYRGQGREA
jgi:predicted RNase H-like HicB family nuclease